MLGIIRFVKLDVKIISPIDLVSLHVEFTKENVPKSSQL